MLEKTQTREELILDIMKTHNNIHPNTACEIADRELARRAEAAAFQEERQRFMDELSKKESPSFIINPLKKGLAAIIASVF